MNEDLQRVVKQLDYLVERGMDLHPRDPVIGVIQYLRREGIKGRLGSSKTCPIANYVAKETGIPVGISRSSVAVAGQHETAGVPPMIRTFIDLFDVGAIPDLEGVTVI